MADGDSQVLLHRVRKGSEIAAAQLHERYAAALVVMARRRLSAKFRRRFEPEDIVQSTFRSFFRRAREGRYQLGRQGDLWRLLCAIAMHKLQGHARRNSAGKRSVDAEASVCEDAMAPGLMPEAQAAGPRPDDAAALVEELRFILQQLSPLHSTVLQLRSQGYTIEEIAEKTGASVRTIYRTLAELKQLLQRRLQESGCEP